MESICWHQQEFEHLREYRELFQFDTESGLLFPESQNNTFTFYFAMDGHSAILGAVPFFMRSNNTADYLTRFPFYLVKAMSYSVRTCFIDRSVHKDKDIPILLTSHFHITGVKLCFRIFYPRISYRTCLPTIQYRSISFIFNTDGIFGIRNRQFNQRCNCGYAYTIADFFGYLMQSQQKLCASKMGVSNQMIKKVGVGRSE